MVKDGGNLLIEDISNSTITQLQTETKVTDILEVHNDGTGPALLVNQTDSFNYPIVYFQDNSVNVFDIKFMRNFHYFSRNDDFNMVFH